MTAPRKPRTPRVRPADVQITDRPGIDALATESTTPAYGTATFAVPDDDSGLVEAVVVEPTVGGGGIGELTLTAVVEPVPGAPTDAAVLVAQRYGDPLPTTVDEYVNGALLAVTDDELGKHPDIFGAAAAWAIEGIKGIPTQVHVAHPSTAVEEAQRLQEQNDLRTALVTREATLNTRMEIIATAITAAGRNAPTEAPDGYRADLAGVIADWLVHALDQFAQRQTPPASSLTNADVLNQMSAQHRESVGQ